MSLILLYLALAAYGVAAGFGAAYVRSGLAAGPSRARAAALVGFAAHTAFLAWWGAEHGRLPAYAPFEALVSLLWAAGLVYFALDYATRLRALPAFVMPLLALGGVVIVALVRPEAPAGHATRSWWLVVHVVASLVGAADFVVAFAVAVMYLVQRRQLKGRSVGPLMERLPSLDALDRLNYRAISLGMPLFTLSLISGVVLAVDKGPGWWASWPIALSFLLWIVYALLLHARLGAGWRGPRVAYLTLVGFVLVVLIVCGIAFLGDSVHTLRPRGGAPTSPTAGGSHAP
jgi:ABC-type transport system involved in cytochrome c biogenesis permease subunit